MYFHLQGKEPLYEQIKNQIIKWIQAGVLNAHDKLPSVRNLAIELGINPNTVARSYQELEEEGYIYSLNKKGYYIKKDMHLKDQKNIFQEKIQLLVDEYHALGLSYEDLRQWTKEVFANAGTQKHQ